MGEYNSRVYCSIAYWDRLTMWQTLITTCILLYRPQSGSKTKGYDKRRPQSGIAGNIIIIVDGGKFTIYPRSRNKINNK